MLKHALAPPLQTAAKQGTPLLLPLWDPALVPTCKHDPDTRPAPPKRSGDPMLTDPSPPNGLRGGGMGQMLAVPPRGSPGLGYMFHADLPLLPLAMVVRQSGRASLGLNCC